MMFTVKQILEATGGRLIQGDPKAKVKGISIDSRKVKAGELFVAVKGDVFDGHDFIDDVIKQKVTTLIIHRPLKIKDLSVNAILVDDTTRALGHLARYHRLRFKCPVIALTGSAGKTTTKEMIAAVLARKYRVLKSEGTQNNHIGVPLTLLKLTKAHQAAVIECGTNQPGDIPWLVQIVVPDVAVFTNIGESHLERLKSLQGVLKEKWMLTSLISPSGAVIVNADDPLLSAQAKKFKKAPVSTYGIARKASFKAEQIRVKEGNRISFNVLPAKQTIELGTCGIDHVFNALAAYSVGAWMGVAKKDIALALKAFSFPKGRGQILRLGRGWLVNDSYNSNPVSMRSAIATLEKIETKGQRVMIAADMLELGRLSKSMHRQIGETVALSKIDVLITVGDRARDMALAAGAKRRSLKVIVCKDAEAAQAQVAREVRNGDAVLIKGSRRMAMEKIVDFLLMAPGASLQ